MGFSNVAYTDERVESLIAELRPKFERAQEVALLARETFAGKKKEARVIHVGRRDLDFLTGESTWVPLCGSRMDVALTITGDISDITCLSCEPLLPVVDGIVLSEGRLAIDNLPFQIL